MTKAPPGTHSGAGPLHAQPAVSAPGVRTCRHTARMGDEVVFMVRGPSRETCQQYVTLLCTLTGAEPAGRITDTMPPGWIGRAVLRPAAGEEADGT
jgi:hypothetical protein